MKIYRFLFFRKLQNDVQFPDDKVYYNNSNVSYLKKKRLGSNWLFLFLFLAMSREDASYLNWYNVPQTISLMSSDR